MDAAKPFEEFPLRLVAPSVLFTFLMYGLGAFIILGLGSTVVAFYMLYCLWIESRLLSRSCVNCYYYGKFCGLGRGKICSLFHKKGDPGKFIKDKITLKDLIPDFLVALIPITGAVTLLSRGFTIQLAGLTIIYTILSFAGNAVIRGQITCKYCKQKKLGCPAEQYFNK